MRCTSGRRSSSTSTPPRATVAAISCAGYGQPCSPWPNDRYASLPTAPPTSPPPPPPATCGQVPRTRACGSALAAATPSTSRSPRRTRRPPRWVSVVAIRPTMFCTGGSRHSTSLSACPMLPRPPERVVAKRSSVSISRSALPIQSAVARWAASRVRKRSVATASSCGARGCARIRDGRSAPGWARRCRTRSRISDTIRCRAGPASGPGVAARPVSRTSPGTVVSASPNIRARVNIGIRCVYPAIRSAVPRPAKPFTRRSATCSTRIRSSIGSTSASASCSGGGGGGDAAPEPGTAAGRSPDRGTVSTLGVPLTRGSIGSCGRTCCPLCQCRRVRANSPGSSATWYSSR